MISEPIFRCMNDINCENLSFGQRKGAVNLFHNFSDKIHKNGYKYKLRMFMAFPG